MASESDLALRRVPTLVSYCQRALPALSAHADAITCLGDDIRYDVIKPVLECCSADTLLRLEQSSPYLEHDTSDLWERLCFKSYPLLAEQLVRDGDDLPDSWRDQYFILRKAEAHRLEEVASRLRNQRMEAAVRKKEREVKLTDRLPPAKRVRGGWGTPSQPKTLFQKTRNEATKLSRSLYTQRAIQMPPSKVHRVLPSSTGTSPLQSSSSPSTKLVNTRVTAETVTMNPPSISSVSHEKSAPLSPISSPPSQIVLSPSSKVPVPAHPPSQSTDPRPSTGKPPIPKKDPMASIFMPKHRALSQLPSQVGSNSRSVPSR